MTTSLLISPFVLHALVEIPAGLNFLLNPDGQLGRKTEHARAIIRQYALLLISSSLIALIFAFRTPGGDNLSGQIAGALAIYHIGPLARASSRILVPQAQASESSGPAWEPWSHLTAHTICLLTLAQHCWLWYLSSLLT